MKKLSIERISIDEHDRESYSDWERVNSMSEEEVESNARSDKDNPPLTDQDLARMQLLMPGELQKVPVSIRLDAEVIDFFKRQGPRYQSRINAVLLGYVRSRRGEAPDAG